MIEDTERAMTGEALRRLVYATGIASTLAFVVGGAWLQLAGVKPIDSSGELILQSATDHRTSLLACYVFWNAANLVQLVFLLALSFAVYRAGHPLSAMLGAGSATALAALIWIGYAFLGALAFRAPDVSAESSQLLSDLFYLTLSLAGLPGALTAAALSWPMLQARGLMRWAGWLGMASALAHLEAAMALARSGAWSPGGWGGYLAPALIVAWLFVVGFVFCRSQSPLERR